MISSVYGINPYVSSDVGFYEFLPLHPNSQNIVYTDYETGIRTYLCDNADCSHDNENCPSWFEGIAGLQFAINPYNNQLFLFQAGIPADNGSQKIYSMDLNGANRKLLLQLPSDEYIVDGCAVDKDNLYFTVRTPASDWEHVTKELRQLNIETGEMVLLMGYGGTDGLMGAFDDQLVIVSMERASETYTYYTFSLTTKELQEFYRYTVADTSGQGWGNIARCHGDQLYIVEPTANLKASIHQMDIMSGETHTITTELPYYTLDGTFVEDFVDNHMIIRVADNRVPGAVVLYQYAVDLATNTLMEITLAYTPADRYANAAYIVGVSDTHYLVLTAEEYRVIAQAEPDGTQYTVDMPFFVYSMITKEDYWNGVANYLPIEDTVLV